MAKFPKDTFDAVEMLYGEGISKNFPQYGVFWERFIGRNPSSNKAEWYPVKFPQTMLTSDRARFTRWRQELSMAHYSLFCNLSGCHFQLNELVRLTVPPITKEIFFKHWECFECFYFRLGNCYYQVYHLWEIMAELKQPGLKVDQYVRIEGIIREWLYFKRRHKKFSLLRDNLTHYSRVGHRELEGGFYIPRTIKEGHATKRNQELWSNQLKRKNWRRTNVKMRLDLEESASVFNRIHTTLIRKFDKCLKSKGISIKVLK